MKIKESMLQQYAAPLSESENQMCLNAIHMVRDALKGLGFSYDRPAAPLYEGTYAYALEMRHASQGRHIKIFVQGSYANNTNVRTESDVDIAVVREDVFKTEYRTSTAPPQTDADYGFVVVPPSSKNFKDEVQECLEREFGNDVERGNKSIKIHGNTYRKDADAVPCQRYRDYRKDYTKNPANYVGGVVIYPDEGGRIINYPEQHIMNGRKKDISTNHSYKRMVRIMKKMRHLMSDAGINCADEVSSFGLESLLWNVPDSEYGNYTLGLEFSHLVNYLWRNTANFPLYKEANGIKPLCPTAAEATAYAEFIVSLHDFFEYDLG